MKKTKTLIGHFPKSALLSYYFGFTFLLASLQSWGQSEEMPPRNLLSNRYTPSVESLILPYENWKPFPTYQDRQAWDTLEQATKAYLIDKGEQALDFTWPSLTATSFLGYKRNGNRSQYQDERNERRKALRDLVMAELLEGKGRFLDQIANGIWVTCEESYWGVPAHLYMQEAGPGLPDIAEPTVDLFAAQTANLLAWSHYLLGEKLNEVSPLILPRIEQEVKARILEPVNKREDFWWMGLEGQQVNNWNPWVTSNWLSSTLLLEKDPSQRIASVKKMLHILDQFINSYPEDGSCDEGPSYWGRAGASLFDCLELLYSASNGQINIYQEPIIQNMGKYIYKVHIGHNYYVNFADATAKATPPIDLIFRYGQRIQDETMQSFGAYLFQQQKTFQVSSSMDRNLFALWNHNQLSQATQKASFVRDVWYPGNQVMLARSYVGSEKGLLLAAQGGHNNESHNHNDVGNFIIYVDGYPAIIDAGVGTYTAKTFGPERYSIWNMQSAFHNVPTINGIMQNAGRKYEATAVNYRVKNSAARFTLDLAKAYPPEAGVAKWTRQLQLNRGKQITLVDRFRLNNMPSSLTQTLMTSCEVSINPSGEIRLKGMREDGSAYNLFILYAPAQFEVTQEKVMLNQDEQDERLMSIWGESLTRISLKARRPSNTGTWKLLFTQ